MAATDEKKAPGFRIQFREISTVESDQSPIRVLQYNVLAQRYCSERLLPYVRPAARKWPHRRENFKRFIAKTNPDLISLQECDFFDWWGAALKQLGYACCYQIRPGKNEGLLLAWRIER